MMSFSQSSRSSPARMTLWIAGVVTGALMLGGCETTERITDYFDKPVVLPCPDFRILADAAHYTAYRSGGGRDLTDVDVEGNFADMRLACTTNIDKQTKTGVMDVEVLVDFAAGRGPANTTRKAEFPYFISVTDLDYKVLYREEFKTRIGFNNNLTGLQFRAEPVVLELPLKPDLTGENYIVFTGFVLSREQLQANRTRRRQTTR